MTTSKSRGPLTNLLVWSLTASLLLPYPAVLAGPSGGQVVDGQGSITQQGGNTTQILQQSQRLAIEWQNFDIAANETVVFQQPGASAVALNRILSQDPSQIFGALNANGQVFLINPSGIVFGPNARVDVASLVASTLDLSVDDFMRGNYNLQAVADRAGGLVVNRGTLTAATGGSIALVGSEVRNEGVIVADYGRVSLAAGEQATVDFDGDGMLLFALTPEGDGSTSTSQDAMIALNTGTISAEGGEVLMSAQAARDVVSSVVNNEGIIEAGRIDSQGGVIRLVGSGVTTNSGVLDASGRTASDTGGSVRVLGDEVRLESGARVSATGAAGGGEVLVGGGFQGGEGVQTAQTTRVARGATIDVSANAGGDAGRAIVWSDDTTVFRGSIAARGGADGGDGGLVEVSGLVNLTYRGEVDASAPGGG
ncbi:MAG: filamentous hemagglutinin N-terminal domain-containing protein, partial [Pseudomonadota bacterium]